MRQFLYILVAAYLVVGIGAGLVFYQERTKDAGPEATRDQVAAEAVVAGLLWPLYILDILAEHDARELS